MGAMNDELLLHATGRASRTARTMVHWQSFFVAMHQPALTRFSKHVD